MDEPIFQQSYTDTEKRIIAGWVLQQRASILQALESVSDPVAGVAPAWQNPQVRYYAAGESLTRLWLFKLGYRVSKDQLTP